jgi:hypothetical protein
VYGVSKVLKEHRTHSIIITNDISDSKPFDRECYGLIWRDRDYKNTRYEVIKENVKNLAILPDI